MMSDEVTISTSEDNQQKMLIGDSFHIGAGFLAKEHPYVLEALSALGPHLGRWDPDDVSVEVTLQDRRGYHPRASRGRARADPATRTPKHGAGTHAQLATQRGDPPPERLATRAGGASVSSPPGRHRR